MRNSRILASAIIAATGLSGCTSIQGPAHLPAPAADTKEYKQGVVYRDYWLGVKGDSIDELKKNPKYPATPDGFDVLTKLQGPIDWQDNYGARVEALVTPPATGNYTFYITSDDYSELWLSSDATPGKKQLIASVPGAALLNEWNKFPQQVSAAVRLEQGKQYYLEIVHKEGGWEDHFSVAWQGPGTSFQVIGGASIAPYLPNAATGTSDDFIKGYSAGYRVGYDDGQYDFPYAPGYPAKDTDRDGLPDNWEIVMGLDPNDPKDALADTDNDLLSNYDEYVLRTNPQRADTDNDGLPDGYETAYGLSPLDPSDATGDLDGDGLTNLQEYKAGTDPSDRTSGPKPPEPPKQPEEPETPVAPAPSMGNSGLAVDYWYSVSGDKVSDLTSQRSFPASPTKTGTISNFELPMNAADNYGTRIRGYVIPPSTGTYRFYVNSDDYSELYLSSDEKESNKSLLVSVSSWLKLGSYKSSTSVHLEAGKPYYIEALYKESIGDDYMSVAWSGPGFERQVIKAEHLRQPDSQEVQPIETIQLVNGFVGQYFNSKSLTNYYGTRFDKQINFDWGTNSPMPGVSKDNFSVRWIGKLKGTHNTGSQTYTFYLKADDGVRMWIDNKLLIDKWADHSPTEHTATYTLEAGRYHDIKIEYYENGYDASASLSWQPAGGTKSVVPASNIYSLDLTANADYDGDKDGMADVWELQYGLDTTVNDSQVVLNSSNISAVKAFQQKLNPWTAKTGTATAPAESTAPTLAWNTPTTRVDGSALYPYEVDHYELRYGTSASNMSSSVTIPGTETSYELQGLGRGTHYFTIYAIDTKGMKSASSNTVTVNQP